MPLLSLHHALRSQPIKSAIMTDQKLSDAVLCNVLFHGGAQRRQHLLCCITMTNEKAAFFTHYTHQPF